VKEAQWWYVRAARCSMCGRIDELIVSNAEEPFTDAGICWECASVIDDMLSENQRPQERQKFSPGRWP